MAQTSLPQAGSGVGDSGPYTADDWAKFYEVVFTGDQAATQSVLRNHLNELEVTKSGVTITIDTGAGFCYGHWLLNDAGVDITAIACAGVETGWHRVVLVQNETAVAYNTNLLLPAAYAAGVPRNSCRIAILRGTCGSPGVLPALITGPNIYMVEIARYQMTGGSVGAITDYREYCEFSTLISSGAGQIEDRTRQFFVPALLGTNATAGWTDISLSYSGTKFNGPILILPDGANSLGQGRFVIPSDYSSAMTAQTVILAQAAGNIYGETDAYVGECGGAIIALSGTTGDVVEVVTSTNTYSCLGACSIPGAAAIGDLVVMTYIRNGNDALDTVNTEVWLAGWIIEYTADS